jgi:hypothetical protein
MKTLKDRSRKNTVEAREAEQGKRPAGFVDLTPTWSAVLPILLTALEYGNQAGKASARIELTRMATLADEYVKHAKRGSQVLDPVPAEPFAND